jgi:outer membrane protein W
LRKYFDFQSKFEPYIGGGINLAYASQKNSSQQNNDASGITDVEDMDTGLWLNGGVDFLINDDFTVGADLRYANAEVELYDQAVELGAFTTGISLGYRW